MKTAAHQYAREEVCATTSGCSLSESTSPRSHGSSCRALSTLAKFDDRDAGDRWIPCRRRHCQSVQQACRRGPGSFRRICSFQRSRIDLSVRLESRHPLTMRRALRLFVRHRWPTDPLHVTSRCMRDRQGVHAAGKREHCGGVAYGRAADAALGVLLGVMRDKRVKTTIGGARAPCPLDRVNRQF